jgi:hypothetical protein
MVNNNDDDSVDGLSLPIFGIRSIIEERKIKHEQDLHSFAHGLFAKLDIKNQITLAVDEGKDTVSIKFPDDLIVPVNSMFIGKVTYADVWSCFSNLLNDEQINFQFKSGKLGGCCFEPKSIWPEDPLMKRDSLHDYFNHYGINKAVCKHCNKFIEYSYKTTSWKWSGRASQEISCCNVVRKLNQPGATWRIEEIASSSSPCENCKKRFKPIPENGELAMHGLELQIS